MATGYPACRAVICCACASVLTVKTLYLENGYVHLTCMTTLVCCLLNLSLPLNLGSEEGEGSWLLLRHFPKWLTPVDKESLLTHFGAVEVVNMPTRGRMVISP